MKKGLIFFLLVSISVISLWFLLYQNYIHTQTDFDHYLSENLAEFGNWFLRLFGHDPYIEYSGTNFVITNLIDSPTLGVWIGDRCNGFKMFGVFAAIVAAFPYSHKQKIWFIPLGILVLHTINAIRVAALTYLAVYYPEYLDFNHNITFEVIVYGSVFLLWYIWIKKFVEKEINAKT